MMTNLFSIFDPTSSFKILNNWIVIVTILLLMPSYWIHKSKFNILIEKANQILHKEFKLILGPTMSKGTTLLLTTLFLFIFMNNFLSLFPYIFSSTSHLVVNMSLALPMWLSLMLYGWTKKTNQMFAHLLPQSTPMLLMPFMVLIETISNMIRPLTLAIRLMANMVAGHLLLMLMGASASQSTSIMLGLIILSQIALLILELAISLIQSYVFSVLVTLYTSETSNH